MYAIALHDRATRRLVLARDPFGIKPLYTAEVPGGLAFASEPQALIAAGLVQPRLRPEAVEELLQLQFTTGAETIFAASTACCRARRSPSPMAASPSAAAASAARGRAGGHHRGERARPLDAALEESVALHQRSDVPYGMFLSGGTDSAAVLAMMARLNESPVTAFTAGFDVPGAADERAAAASAARAAGARHVTVSVDEAAVWRHLPEIVACMDDPAADYAIIPTWFLAAARGRR
jgi:asparagine synthase (glutamine-hydrolysing)